MDRPYFMVPFQLLLGVQQVRLASKSQRYRAQCQSNQKLLPNSQHAKNQLNSQTHSFDAGFRVS